MTAPFKAFAFPIHEFYRSRYEKLAMTMSCIDTVTEGSVGALERCPGMSKVGEPLFALAEAAKDYAQTLRSDADVFDCWANLAVARQRLEAFRAELPRGSLSVQRDLALEAEFLVREVCQLLFSIARARVPMPKSAADICLRVRSLAERAHSVDDVRSAEMPLAKSGTHENQERV